MKRTLVAVFDRFVDAQRAVVRVAGLGIDRRRIHLRSAYQQNEGSHEGEPGNEVLDGIRSFFAELFGPNLSAERYTEEIRRGSAVVAVEVANRSEYEKVRAGLMRCGAARLDGGEDQDETEVSPQMARCIEVCRICHKTCLQVAMTHCLELGGQHVEPEHFRLLLNCAEICHTAANFMTSRSHLSPLLCGVVAEVCDACARSCDDVGDMDACAEVCRDCGENCRRMAEAAA
jgi:hypothetical protein